MRHLRPVYLALFFLLFFAGCQSGIFSSSARGPEPEALSGGQATVFDTTRNAFSHPIPGLERPEELLFFVGNSFFNQNWVTAPASTTARDGLGPFFNARSCAGCHFKDGRGRPPAFDGETPTGFLLRLSIPGSDIHGGPLPEPNYGGQIQDRALEKLTPEAAIRVTYEEMPFTFPDGEVVNLRQPTYHISDLAFGDLHPETMVSPRVANHIIGMGLLDAVAEEDLLALADPTDRDNDGISGRPNYVWDTLNSRMTIGRFGWKANEPTVLQQSAGAFLGDMGITTPLFPTENCTEVAVDCQAALNGGTPEIIPEDFLKVVLYVSTLAVPARRDLAETADGEELFAEIGCASCHTPQLETAVHPTIPALSHQTIRPYTDLLLHDMGEGLADGRPDFQATGSEWRTPPLWGIGLIETVNGHTNFLHDGRARNLLEAILWHGGEAEAARDAFAKLSAAEREALLRFLESL
ncbi:MAG: di-heme oxidoredictase family protein [Chloroflexota bacterium]